jgi:RNA polymerase sigma factor (sigma-70 family)
MINKREEAKPEQKSVAGSRLQSSAKGLEPEVVERSAAESSVRRRKWDLTEEAFARLLAALAPEPERAGEEYEKLRRKLVKFFAWEGCASPEDLADETINRLAKRISEGETIRDVSSYCYATARFVLLEALKEQQRERRALDQFGSPETEAEDAEADEAALDCLRQCLEGFAPETRELIMQYYQGEKRARIENRRRLAAQLKIPLNTLRNRALRLRERLQACLDDCLGGKELV